MADNEMLCVKSCDNQLIVSSKQRTDKNWHFFHIIQRKWSVIWRSYPSVPLCGLFVAFTVPSSLWRIAHICVNNTIEVHIIGDYSGHNDSNPFSFWINSIELIVICLQTRLAMTWMARHDRSGQARTGQGDDTPDQDWSGLISGGHERTRHESFTILAYRLIADNIVLNLRLVFFITIIIVIKFIIIITFGVVSQTVCYDLNFEIMFNSKKIWNYLLEIFERWVKNNWLLVVWFVWNGIRHIETDTIDRSISW